MNPQYPFVAARAVYRCEYCHAPQAISNSPFQVEHVHPLAHGGDDKPANLALACPSCNVFKGAALHEHDPNSGLVVALFNPRSDTWDKHFKVEVATMHIEGLTPVGRATVQRLRMNRDLSVLARGYWAMIGLFP